MPDVDEAYLQIGEVAERTGVTQRTLRFYEEKGLLRPPSRMVGGFRLYSEQDVKRVEHIRRLQDLLGVALAEIKEMVEAEEVLRELRAQYRPDSAIDEKRRQLERAIDVVQGQYSIVKQKTEQMEEMKAQLKERLKTFDRWMKELNELETKEAVAPGSQELAFQSTQFPIPVSMLSRAPVRRATANAMAAMRPRAMNPASNEYSIRSCPRSPRISPVSHADPYATSRILFSPWPNCRPIV